MKTTKMIRYIGFGLLILSTVLLSYLFSFSLGKDTKASSTNQYAVLEISSDSYDFPQADFDALFSKLNLVSDFVQIDAEETAEEQVKQIASAVRGLESDHVILFARKDACIPALTSALSNSEISSVILLCPAQDASGNADSFGTYQPNLPIAVFDADTNYSTSLFERLSGEDASLFPGLKDDGKMPAEVFISPDGSRYLSQWKILGNAEADQSILAFLPQVQIKIGEYISTYVFDPSVIPAADSRSQVGTVHIIKSLAAAFLAAGLLLFFASIPKPRRETQKEAAESVRKESITTVSAPEAAASSAVRADSSENRAPAAVERARARAFLLSSLTAILYSAGMIALYLRDLKYATEVLGFWPVVYYASSAVFLFRYFPMTITGRRVPSGRVIFSGFLALFFTGGVFLLSALNSYSLSKVFTGINGALLTGVLLVLFILSWVRMSSDTLSFSEKRKANGRTSMCSSRLMYIPLVFPYAAVLVLMLAQRHTVLFLQCLYLLAALAAGSWIRSIFRRTSGTEWLAAAVFAAFYSLVAFT